MKEQQQPAFEPGIKEKHTFAVPQWALPAVIIFTALLFGKALFNDFIILDDSKYIPDNPLIKDFSLHGIKIIFTSFYAGFYQPLVMLTYLFEYRLFGLNPLPYHLTNVLLHLVNTVLVFKFSERLSGKRMTALVVSVLFAVHPMHVESVAWATERKDVLFTLFYLLSLLSYLRYLQTGYKTKHFIFTILFFVFSLLSKAAAVTLPVLLIAIDLYKGRKISRSYLIEKIPLLLLSLFFGILAVISQKGVGAISDLAAYYGYFNRIFLLTYSLSFYLVMLLAPFNLSAMHYYPITSGGYLPWLYYASLPFLLLVAWLIIRNKSFRKEILFGMFFFLITISVMLQIVPVGLTITSERFTYIPYIGLFYLAGQMISDIRKKRGRSIAVAVFILFVLLFSYLSFARISIWKNSETLSTDIINKHPEIYHSYYLRGVAKNINSDIQGALKDYSTSILLSPDYDEAYSSRGLLYFEQGKISLALFDYNKAIMLNAKSPTTYNNRGLAIASTGDTMAALRDYNKAILLDPLSPEPYKNRCLIKISKNDLTGALQDIRTAIHLLPGSAEFYCISGFVKELINDDSGAEGDYKIANTLNPRNYFASSIKGDYKKAKGDLKGALQEYNKVLACNPDNITILLYTGDIHNSLNNFAGAIMDANHIISLDSTNAKAYSIRGDAFNDSGDKKKAMLDYDKAIQLDPSSTGVYNNRSVLKIITGDIQGALTDINSAIKTDTNNPELYCTRGFIKTLQKNYKEAVEDYDYSIKLNPGINKVYYFRGLALLDMNNKAGACEDWKKAAVLGNTDAPALIKQHCR